MLIALEFHLRGIEPEPVAGFRTWLKLGRCVRKGEHGIRVAARVAPCKAERSADAEPEQIDGDGQERRIRFTTVSVFGVSQTDPLPGAEQLPLEPPRQPLTGCSHAHLLEPLRHLACELGYTVAFEEVPGAANGWCDSTRKLIAIDCAQAMNGQVRTLVHELIHALGVTYETHTRPEAEVIVDTATLIVLSGAGLDTSGESIPYVAGWGEQGALDAVTERAELIDRLARTVERAIETETQSEGGEPSMDPGQRDRARPTPTSTDNAGLPWGSIGGAQPSTGRTGREGPGDEPALGGAVGQPVHGATAGLDVKHLNGPPSPRDN